MKNTTHLRATPTWANPQPALLFGLLAALCAVSWVPSAAARELVIGTISTRPDYHLPRLQPLAEYAAKRLSAQGITSARVLLAADTKQLARYFAEGRLDWAGITIAAASEVGDVATLGVMAIDKRGVDYKSLYFVRQDCTVERLDQLLGKRLALRSVSSTSSYFVPLMQLAALNLPTQRLVGPRDFPSSDRVGISISGSETNSALWVLHGLADVGVANSIDWQDTALFAQPLRSRLRVIAQSDAVPLGIELFSKQLPRDIRQALTDVLLDASEHAEGRSAMQSYSNTVRFETIKPDLAKTLAAYGARFAQIRITQKSATRSPSPSLQLPPQITLPSNLPKVTLKGAP